MDIRAEVVVAKPIQEVFEGWSQVERYPEWFGAPIKRERLTDGPIGVGTRFLAIDKLPPGRRVESTLEITSYEPNTFLAATLSGSINATWEARFEETDEGTRLTLHLAVDLSGLQGLVKPFIAGWSRRDHQAGLDSFKASLEG